jgi:acetyltransferase-like isoleucine patch superfamily enzyme/uncharacterized membrane protein YbhN (UPF0104 family)
MPGGVGWRLARLVVTVGLLALLVFVVSDPRRLLQDITHVRPGLLLIAVALSAGDRVVMAYKWSLLLAARGLEISLSRAIRTYFVATFAGLFLPVTIGADAVRVLALRQHSAFEVTASIIVERVLGMVAMASVALVSTGLLAMELSGEAVGPLVVAVVVVAVMGLVAFVASLFLAGGRLPVSGRLAPLAKVAEAYGRYRERPGVLAAFYLLSAGESLLPAAVGYTVAVALGFAIPLWVFIATMPIAFTVARLPISFGGFGVQEASFVYLAGLLGIASTAALSIMLVSDAVLIVTLLPAILDLTTLNLRPPARRERVVSSDAVDRKLDNVPREIFDGARSKRQRYQGLVVGRSGWGALLGYEVVVMFAARTPGALGLWLRSRLYPLLLGACGRNVFFGTDVTLRHPHKIHIGDDVAIDDGCVLDAKGTSNAGIRIGRGVFIGRHTSVHTKDGDVVLEDGVNISSFCSVFSASRVTVGRDTLIAGYSYVIGGGHEFGRTDVAIIDQPRPSRGISIGPNCWIGAGVAILDGVTIGQGAIVGANSVVTRDLADFAVAAGSPATVIRYRQSLAASGPS